MDNAGKAPKRIGKSPNCYWCGALKEKPKNGLCNSCKALEARQNRAKKRAEKGLAPYVRGKNPNCGKCGGEKSNPNSYYCTKCASIQRKEAVKKRKEAGLPSYDYSRSPNCYSCGKIKENLAKGYCLECRRIKQRESDLKKGIIKNHRKGTCSICHTDWVHKRSCDCINLVRNHRKMLREEKFDLDFFLKEAARRKCGRAIQSGKLIRMPCVECGNPNSDAHHEDYTKPLDVVWLCRLHHMQLHAEKNKAEGVVIARKYERKDVKENIPLTKCAAKRRLDRAVKSGKVLKSPCAICGAEKSEGHHIDYSRPLDVIWLCRAHHSKIYSNGYKNHIEKNLSDISINKEKILSIKKDILSQVKKSEERFFIKLKKLEEQLLPRLIKTKEQLFDKLKKLEDKEKELDENSRILKNIEFLWTIEKNQDRSMSVEQILNVLSSQEASIL